MPYTEGTLTPEDVAEHLGQTVTDRVTTATDAAIVWAQNRRSLIDPFTLFEDPAIHYGAKLYAALLVLSASTPAGFAGYDETGVYESSTMEALFRARDLVGHDAVIA